VLRTQPGIGHVTVVGERDPMGVQEAEHLVDLALPALQVRRLAAVREAAVEADAQPLGARRLERSRRYLPWEPPDRVLRLQIAQERVHRCLGRCRDDERRLPLVVHQVCVYPVLTPDDRQSALLHSEGGRSGDSESRQRPRQRLADGVDRWAAAVVSGRSDHDVLICDLDPGAFLCVVAERVRSTMRLTSLEQQLAAGFKAEGRRRVIAAARRSLGLGIDLDDANAMEGALVERRRQAAPAEAGLCGRQP
jgi:hypothetical protein